jgi:hypothetical protein
MEGIENQETEGCRGERDIERTEGSREDRE